METHWVKAHLENMQSRTTKPHLVSKTLDTILLLDHEKKVENTRIPFQSKHHHEIKDPKQIVAKLTILNAFLTRKNTATKKSTSNRAARAVKLKEVQKEKPNGRLFPVTEKTSILASKAFQPNPPSEHKQNNPYEFQAKRSQETEQHGSFKVASDTNHLELGERRPRDLSPLGRVHLVATRLSSGSSPQLLPFFVYPALLGFLSYQCALRFQEGPMGGNPIFLFFWALLLRLLLLDPI